MEKYSLLRRRVMQGGLSGGEALREPHAATDGEILRTHDTAYLRRVGGGELSPVEERQIGFPWTPQLVERSRRSAGATIEACRAALEEGIGVNLAGADPYRDDRLGRLALSNEGLRARDPLVLDLCRTACLQVAIVMAGGYTRNITDTVDIHFSTLEVATQFQFAAQQSHASSPTEMR
jgi:acetoin utilization deacetylase AcuC-like enzyme